jgi:hypothetical protein
MTRIQGQPSEASGRTDWINRRSWSNRSTVNQFCRRESGRTMRRALRSGESARQLRNSPLFVECSTHRKAAVVTDEPSHIRVSREDSPRRDRERHPAAFAPRSLHRDGCAWVKSHPAQRVGADVNRDEPTRDPIGLPSRPKKLIARFVETAWPCGPMTFSDRDSSEAPRGSWTSRSAAGRIRGLGRRHPIGESGRNASVPPFRARPSA